MLESKCVHIWLCETNTDKEGMVNAVCKLCGAKSKFIGSYDVILGKTFSNKRLPKDNNFATVSYYSNKENVILVDSEDKGNQK